MIHHDTMSFSTAACVTIHHLSPCQYMCMEQASAQEQARYTHVGWGLKGQGHIHATQNRLLNATSSQIENNKLTYMVHSTTFPASLSTVIQHLSSSLRSRKNSSNTHGVVGVGIGEGEPMVEEGETAPCSVSIYINVFSIHMNIRNILYHTSHTHIY